MIKNRVQRGLDKSNPKDTGFLKMMRSVFKCWSSKDRHSVDLPASISSWDRVESQRIVDTHLPCVAKSAYQHTIRHKKLLPKQRNGTKCSIYAAILKHQWFFVLTDFFFFFLINSLFGREAKMPRADQSAKMMKFHRFSHSELVFVI